MQIKAYTKSLLNIKTNIESSQTRAQSESSEMSQYYFSSEFENIFLTKAYCRMSVLYVFERVFCLCTSTYCTKECMCVCFRVVCVYEKPK